MIEKKQKDNQKQNKRFFDDEIPDFKVSSKANDQDIQASKGGVGDMLKKSINKIISSTKL